MTHDDIAKTVTACLEDRVRDAIKGVLEEVMQEEMTAQLQAKHRERTVSFPDLRPVEVGRHP